MKVSNWFSFLRSWIGMIKKRLPYYKPVCVVWVFLNFFAQPYFFNNIYIHTFTMSITYSKKRDAGPQSSDLTNFVSGFLFDEKIHLQESFLTTCCVWVILNYCPFLFVPWHRGTLVIFFDCFVFLFVWASVSPSLFLHPSTLSGHIVKDYFWPQLQPSFKIKNKPLPEW